MAVDLAALRTELDTDPKSLGYAAPLAAGDHVQVASIMNLVRDGSVDPDFKLTKTGVSMLEAMKAIDPTEYAGLTQVKRDGWRDILMLDLSLGKIPNTDPDVRSFINDIWAGATNTLAKLLAIETRNCSRSEKLFGENVAVTAAEIGAAMQI